VLDHRYSSSKLSMLCCLIADLAVAARDPS